MRRRIEFPVGGGAGEVVTVEVEESDNVGLDRAGRPGVDRAEEAFEAAIARIRPVMSGVVDGVRSLAQTPDCLTVEFGVKFDAKTGIVISSVGVEANLRVTLTWQRVGQAPTRP
jgi:hypothetical protein